MQHKEYKQAFVQISGCVNQTKPLEASRDGSHSQTLQRKATAETIGNETQPII